MKARQSQRGFLQRSCPGGSEQNDECDETHTDFRRWGGLYETWRRWRAAHEQRIEQRKLSEELVWLSSSAGDTMLSVQDWETRHPAYLLT